MKVNCWDKCFLCLTNFRSTSTSLSSCRGKKARGNQKQTEINEKPNLSVLIKYLLGDQNDLLLERIRRLLQLQKPNSPASSSECLIKFCDKCQDSARRISNLQMQLEVIQMKIVDFLWSVRKTVVGNSNGHHDGTSGLSLEEFTEERQEVLDTLYAFQAAVIEKCKESVHLPLVYIEKFTGCNLRSTRAIPTTTAEEDEHLNLIKTEPAEADSSEEILSDFGNDYDYAASPVVEFNDGLEDVNLMPTKSGQAALASSSPPLPDIDLLPPRLPRKLQKRSIMSKKIKKKSRKEEKSPGKRGRPRKNPPAQEIKEEPAEFLSFSSEQDANLNPIIKEENSGDPSDDKRKARSAAQTAVKRIADVKKLSKASFQYRPRKVAKKIEKIKTKRNSARALKAGKIFKTPKQGGKKSTSKKAPRIKKLLKCEICQYKTRITVQLEHHLRQHESSEVVNHICPHCTNPLRQFSQKQSFDYHMNSHAGLNKMVCDICTKYIDPFSILEHLRGHPEVEKIFQCSGCSYHCGTREGYLNHIRYHGAAALICDVCSKTFHDRTRMLEHMHNEHNLLEKIKCDVGNCDREFFETWMLQVHKNRHADTFICSECNVQFPTSGQLLRHQVKEHSREKPFQCEECPETFINKQFLQRHLINAHGAAKFKCPHCPKEFKSQGHFNSHINLHQGISFPCDKCDKAFGDRRQLKRHQEVHTTTKDVICEECGKAFAYASLLKTHIKIHIGDKKHKCGYCPKAFVSRKNLTVHERIHTGEKPYVCEACGKDFNQLGPLNQHLKTHHKELIAIKTKSGVTATGSTSTQDELNISFN